MSRVAEGTLWGGGGSSEHAGAPRSYLQDDQDAIKFCASAAFARIVGLSPELPRGIRHVNQRGCPVPIASRSQHQQAPVHVANLGARPSRQSAHRRHCALQQQARLQLHHQVLYSVRCPAARVARRPPQTSANARVPLAQDCTLVSGRLGPHRNRRQAVCVAGLPSGVGRRPLRLPVH